MMIRMIFAVVFLHLASGIDEFYFCDKDPCIQGNTFVLQSKEKRTPNCPNLSDNLCDAYISDGWYRGPAPILKRCTNKNTCGTVFPIWMNGTDPTIEEGVVSRNACLSGPTSCCQKVYKIKVKRCDIFIAYCLPHTGSCPERYCFGETGNCTVPTTTTKSTTTSTTTTTTTASTTTTSTIPTTIKPTIPDKRRPNEGSHSKIPGEHSCRTDDHNIDRPEPEPLATSIVIAIIITIIIIFVALCAILFYFIYKWISERKKSYKPPVPGTIYTSEDKDSAKWRPLWLDN